MHPETDAPGTLSASDTRQICLDEGADDVGYVEIGRESLAFERSDIV
jgi:hypothetical protein